MNIQRSPGSPLPFNDWIHKGLMRQSRSYCLQNLARKAEIFLTQVEWGVRVSVDFARGRHYKRQLVTFVSFVNKQT